MRTTVAVDIGTTQLKLGHFDGSGRLLASEKHPTPVLSDRWGTVYDVEAMMAVIDSFLLHLTAEQRAGLEKIAIAGVGESGGLVGPDLSLASPIIMWHDQRGAAFIDSLTESQRREVYRVTGLPVNANYALSKVAWASAHSEGAGKALTWLNVSEYVAAIMTGDRWAEYSLASRTMALDVSTGTWSEQMCEMAGIDISVFPELRQAAHGQPISAAFARHASLPTTVEVHVAGHDHMVGAVGAGLRCGEVLNSTGTTEGVLMLSDRPNLDDDAARAKLANGVGCDGVSHTLFASIPTGGSAFATLKRMLGMSESALVACIAALAEQYRAGRIDLTRVPVVIPEFRGSPPPEKLSSARGVIAGLRSDVGVEEVVFGTFLGLAVQFDNVRALFPTGADVLKVIGPASVNPLWLQLKADLLGVDLEVSAFPEVVSRGAQALASGASGTWESCDPRRVAAGSGRHHDLQDWRDRAQATVQGLGRTSW